LSCVVFVAEMSVLVTEQFLYSNAFGRDNVSDFIFNWVTFCESFLRSIYIIFVSLFYTE